MANENAPNEAAEKTPGKPKSKSWIAVLVLMAVEGAAIFFGTKFLIHAEPTPAVAAEEDGKPTVIAGSPAALKTPELAEVELAECRPVNKVSGKLITFRMRLSGLVKAEDMERAKTLIDANKARINDRINFVIRSADINHLNEPALETIKRRLKSEIDRAMGDEALIREVLIPEMIPSGSGL